MQHIMTEKEKPLISVIVPIYKVEAYLEQCLDSILRQTWKNLDFFLIDDGSPDACGQICDLYAEKDPRIQVFHTENRGLSAARNLGIEKAKETDSEYLAFVDSDDWLEDNMIETLVEAALSSGADIVVCGMYREFPQRQEVLKFEEKEFNSLEATRAILTDEINNHTMNKIWRKKCFEQFLFPEGRVYEDMAVLYKIFAASNRIRTISDILYHYRNRADSVVHTTNYINTMDQWTSLRERYEYCASHPVFAEDKKLLDFCIQYCVNIARRLWRLYYEQPRTERKALLPKYKEIAAFIKANVSFLGEKDWPVLLRCSALLTRFASTVSFGIAYLLNNIRPQRRRRTAFLYSIDTP